MPYIGIVDKINGFYTIKKISEMLKIPKRTLDKILLNSNGDIKLVKRGRMRIIHHSEIVKIKDLLDEVWY